MIWLCQYEVGNYGINRIRLEFKDQYFTSDSQCYLVLIESDWNLKKYSQADVDSTVAVLIESDWNLKSFNDGTDLFDVC